jgi:hypothetical protein
VVNRGRVIAHQDHADELLRIGHGQSAAKLDLDIEQPVPLRSGKIGGSVYGALDLLHVPVTLSEQSLDVLLERLRDPAYFVRCAPNRERDRASPDVAAR